MDQKFITISISSISEGPYCVSTDDAAKVLKKIKEVFWAEKDVHLSFYGVEALSHAFLTFCIGGLYEYFPEEKIKKSLKYTEISSDDLRMVDTCIRNIESYRKDPVAFVKVLRNAMEEDGDLYDCFHKDKNDTPRLYTEINNPAQLMEEIQYLKEKVQVDYKDDYSELVDEIFTNITNLVIELEKQTYDLF